ncbi:AraC family transcriptional regulator [Poriferisphaera sp. WC338]|uniref:AraC family transcriptional regulator n=1 Tax=Poriferisphaera sp. WC338 TaxID=3425129 RepID=UPI003D81403E
MTVTLPQHDGLLTETYSIGEQTVERVAGYEQVSALARKNITFTGISEAREGFCFVREKSALSQVLLTVKGQGKVYTSDGWKTLKRGMAYVTPRDELHAYYADPGVEWTCCWVSYVEPEDVVPIISLAEPTVLESNPRLLYASILGLVEEVDCRGELHLLEQWVDLIHDYVCRILDSWRVPDRLWHIWEQVNAQLGRKWTISTLARSGHLSPEYLRLLCHRHHGHSPMEHVAHLRMRHASSLLKRTDLKMEAIAVSVGYDNAFSFSRAFKRIMGQSPNQYRSH